VPTLELKKVEVYVFRRRGRRAEFLALRRGPRKSLPGVWQPVTGKIELLETPAEAARREVREETGLPPLRMWRLEHTTFFLDDRGRSLVALPLLAAEVDAKETVKLSREHDAWRFVSAAAAGRLFLWDSQRQGIAAVQRQVLRGGSLARALELAMPGRRARPPLRRRGRAPRRTTT
jgi:8-oxo-dGTP pyrophosphatase MutT (NUDIX family)